MGSFLKPRAPAARGAFSFLLFIVIFSHENFKYREHLR